MKVHVHVKAKTLTVECGEGGQKVIWLGNVGVARYSNFNTRGIGAPRGIRQENGDLYDQEDVINQVLKDGQHVWVALSEKYE